MVESRHEYPGMGVPRFPADQQQLICQAAFDGNGLWRIPYQHWKVHSLDKTPER